MKTKCYCTYCSKHPLYNKRKDFPTLTGWSLGRLIMGADKQLGVDVECLKPVSYAFDRFDIDPNDLEFDITAYDDGSAETGYEGWGIKLYAGCENEDYEGK